jgi:hypothetical protein
MDCICEKLQSYPSFIANETQKLLHGSHNFSAQYIDDFEELPFDADTLRKHIERLIIVSAPLQTFFLETRRIYRWEDPWRTGRSMALYFFLWYISHIMTYFVRYCPIPLLSPKLTLTVWIHFVFYGNELLLSKIITGFAQRDSKNY